MTTAPTADTAVIDFPPLIESQIDRWTLDIIGTLTRSAISNRGARGRVEHLEYAGRALAGLTEFARRRLPSGGVR